MAESSDSIETFVEKRTSDRAPVTVRIEYGSVDAMFSEFTRNINEGGLFIATEKPLGLEERVQLNFQLPGSEEPIKASGRVVRVEDGSGEENSGMGIEFEELDRSARERINELVLQLRAQG